MIVAYNHVSIFFQRQCQPLHYAAYNGHVKAVQLLLSNKANVNARNQVKTAFVYRLASWHLVNKLLLQEGQPPLLAACLAGHKETVKLLLEQHYKENPTELPPTDTANNTLLHMSIIGNHLMVLELLEFMQSLGYTTKQLKKLTGSVNVVRF